MKRWGRIAAGLSVVMALSATGFAEKAPSGTELRITVFVYDYAQVSGKILSEAKREAARTYRGVGVEMEWVDCPTSAAEIDQYPGCASVSGPTRLVLRILSRSMMDGMRLDPSAFGLAVVSQDGGFGYLASVCSECAESLLERTRYSRGMILGNLMAHEIGHLLLNTMDHSAASIMSARWNRVDLKDAAQGQLFFNAKDAKRIRAQVGERMRAETTAQARPPAKITMYIYNYAEVSSEMLAQAKRDVTRIYRQAGIQTQWVDCPFSAEELDKQPACPPSLQLAPEEFTVRILPRTLALPGHGNLAGFGTLPKDGRFGFSAAVYADGPDTLGKGRIPFQHRILGLLIAHEIGHLLLATESHTHSGIMRVPWSAAELARAAQGGLLFDSAQARRMRAQVLQRNSRRAAGAAVQTAADRTPAVRTGQ